MALREIVQIGEPVLRKKAKPVEVIDEKIIQILDVKCKKKRVKSFLHISKKAIYLILYYAKGGNSYGR